MNNQSTDELMMIENTHNVDMWKALEDLYNYPPFIKVFMEGYLRDHVLRNTASLATTHTLQNNLQSEKMGELIAASRLQDYMYTIESMGNIPPESDFED